MAESPSLTTTLFESWLKNMAKKPTPQQMEEEIEEEEIEEEDIEEEDIEEEEEEDEEEEEFEEEEIEEVEDDDDVVRDPLANLQLSDDIEEELLEEANHAFITLRQEQHAFLRDRAWFTLVFENVRQKIEFMNKIRMARNDLQDVDGVIFAHNLKVELPEEANSPERDLEDEEDYEALTEDELAVMGFAQEDLELGNADGFEEEKKSKKPQEELDGWLGSLTHFADFFDNGFLLNVWFDSPRQMDTLIKKLKVGDLFQQKQSGGFTVTWAMGPDLASRIKVKLTDGGFRYKLPKLNPKLMEISLPLEDSQEE